MPGFTRQIILHTLTELMNEKPLSKITVKDIVERCGVNRNTFYYHFRDIPDAVEAMVKEETVITFFTFTVSKNDDRLNTLRYSIFLPLRSFE